MGKVAAVQGAQRATAELLRFTETNSSRST